MDKKCKDLYDELLVLLITVTIKPSAVIATSPCNNKVEVSFNVSPSCVRIKLQLVLMSFRDVLNVFCENKLINISLN